jgi:hypothetical protein
MIDPEQFPILAKHYGEIPKPVESQHNWLPKETEWELHPVLGIIVKG